jgi:hypothetical protein
MAEIIKKTYFYIYSKNNASFYTIEFNDYVGRIVYKEYVSPFDATKFRNKDAANAVIRQLDPDNRQGLVVIPIEFKGSMELPEKE